MAHSNSDNDGASHRGLQHLDWGFFTLEPVEAGMSDAERSNADDDKGDEDDEPPRLRRLGPNEEIPDDAIGVDLTQHPEAQDWIAQGRRDDEPRKTWQDLTDEEKRERAREAERKLERLEEQREEDADEDDEGDDGEPVAPGAG